MWWWNNLLSSARQTTNNSNKTIFTRGAHHFHPRYKTIRKQHKGRVSVKTGNSIKGNEINFGIYGLRLASEGVRMGNWQLKTAKNILDREIRQHSGLRLYVKCCANIAVCTKGNEVRMGKGKGAFDYFAMRVSTGRVLFELGKENENVVLHQEIARDMFRKAAAVLPGICEFITKSDYLPRCGFLNVKPSTKKVNYVKLLDSHPSKEHKIKLLSKSDSISKYIRR